MQIPNQSNQITVNAADLASSDRAEPIRVLHVDDDLSILEVSKQILMMEGNFEVDNACSVDEAFKKLSTGNYDIVVSDYEMPQKNGLQFLKELKEQKNEVPFILFTGKGREEVAIKALNLGADGYFNKQGSPETVYGELSHGIQTVVEGKKLKTSLISCEDKFKIYIGVSPTAIFVVNSEGKYEYVNEAASKLLGYSRKELLEMSIPQLLFQENMADALKNFIEVKETGKSLNETILKRKDGQPVYVILNSVKLPDGKLIAFCEDITERKRSEKENARLASFPTLNPNPIVEADFDGNVCYLNSAAKELFPELQNTGLGHPFLSGLKQAILSFENAKTLSFSSEVQVGGSWYIQVFSLVPESRLVRIYANNIDEAKKTQTLCESEERFRAIFAGASDGILAADIGSKCFVFANSAMCDLTGYSLQELIKLGVEDIHSKEDLPYVLGEFAKLAEGKATIVSDIPVLRKDQKVIYCEVTGKLFCFENKEFLVGFFRDISERKKAEENLKKLKAFDERIINSLSDALLVIDPDDYKIINVNQTSLKQLKLSKENVIGKTCYEMTHQRSTPCQPPNDICPIQEVLKTGNPIIVEHTHIDENNNERIVEVSAQPVRDPEGKTVIIHVAKDITERKQMDLRIREAEKRYHALFDWAPLGILIIDPQTGKIVEFNEKAHEQLGYSREEFAKLHIYDYKAIENQKETNDLITKTLQQGKAEWETTHRTKNGETRDVIIISQAIELSGRKLLQSIYRDVTEAKKIEVALVESEGKYRQLVELAQEGIWALDNHNFTVFVNPCMTKMLGYSESEMIGKNLASFLVKSNNDLAMHNLEGCKLGNPGQCEFEFIQKDGNHIYTNIAASSIQDDTGNYIGTLALVADITGRKKAEIALETSERKYREFADSLPEIVFESDVKGNPLFVNKMALEILGYSADEIKKTNFFKVLVPEDHQRAIETVQKRIQGEKTKGNEFTLQKKDETTFPAMVFTELTQTMTGSYGLRGIIVDLTELKTATKKLIASNEKLRVVGSLTRHDVRNKLSAITGYSYILTKKHADQADVVDGLDKMVQAVKDSMKIFDFAKAYEQLGVEELVDVDVEKAVNEATDMFSSLTFKVVNDCHGLTVRADSLLRQLIYNFIDNTRKYGQKTTTARVSTQKTSNGDLQLIYEDDGLGIPLENKTSLFKEGFSTGGSTGFGLFLSKKMIEVYGWSIQEIGEPGKGAKFVITIPMQ